MISVTPTIIDMQQGYFVVHDDLSNEFDIVNQKYKYFFFMNSPYINRENLSLFNLVIEIENISDIILTEINIHNFKLYDIITNFSGVDVNRQEIREYPYNDNSENWIRCILKPGEKMKLCFKIGMDEYDMTNESFHVNFNLSTKSIYNVLFSQNIDLFRNNIVDSKDRVYVNLDKIYFTNTEKVI